MAITEIMDEFNMNINITRARYAELIKAEAEVNALKAFLSSKLEKDSSVYHNELEILESLGLIRRKENVSDS